MRLHRLTLRSFRGVAERTVTFAERGITIVEGPNEAGKSSLAEALDLLLGYQAHSRAQAVRRVQPVGVDVGSEVAAELTCGPYRLTYAKRFHREHRTTLEIHEPERAACAGGEAHDRMQALLAEHVDEALWRALRVHQGVPLEQADLSAQTSLAAALDTAAGARVGGEREAALFERVRDAYERHHTPTGQPTKARRELAEAEDAARAEVAEAQEALQSVEDDVARCAGIERALADLAPQVDAARRRAAQAQERARAADRRRLEVERLAVDARRATDERERAEAAVAHRQELVERRRAAAHAVAESRAALDRHGPAIEAAGKEAAEARGETEALRAAVAHARAQARAREADVEALRDAEALAAVEERLGRAEAAEADAKAAELALAAGVDDDALAAIEEALADVHRARAVADADAPALRVRRLAPVDLSVDGEPVAADRVELARPVTATTTVRVGDAAEIRIDPGGDAQARAEQVAVAETRLAERLADAGVADVPGARTAHGRRADAEERLERARRTLAEALGDDTLAGLRERRDACAARVAATRTAGADAGAAREAADTARALVEAREQALATAEAGLRDAEARRAALAEATATLRVRAEADEQALADVSAALEAARADTDDGALEVALRDADEAATAAGGALREARTRLADEDPDGTQAASEEAVALRDRLAKEQRGLEDDLRDVRARLGVRGEEGLHDRLAAAERRLAETERERARVEARAAAARCLHDEMAARREAATRAYAAPLREKVERLGRIVYGDDFGVELGDDLRITRRTLRGVALDVEDLSAGAREQLALLTRVAVAGLVARDDGGVPLIVDDALGSSDPVRLERLGAALRVGARDAQVIILTCVPDRYRTVGDATVVRLP